MADGCIVSRRRWSWMEETMRKRFGFETKKEKAFSSPLKRRPINIKLNLIYYM
jgi:hypothetical protein